MGGRGIHIGMFQVIIDKGCGGGEVGRMEGRDLRQGNSQALAADWLRERKRKALRRYTPVSGWEVWSDCGPFNQGGDQGAGFGACGVWQPAPDLGGPPACHESRHWREEFTTKMKYFPNFLQYVFQNKLYDFENLNIILSEKNSNLLRNSLDIGRLLHQEV